MDAAVRPELDPLTALRSADDQLTALRAPHNDPIHALRGDIDLGHDETSAGVSSGPLTPVGVPASEYARLTSTGSLPQRIRANLTVASNPELATAVQPLAARLQAPGTVATAANIAAGNLIAPFSDRAAEAATEHDLAAYGSGGGDAGAHANLFGGAAALGAVAGNVAVGKAVTPSLVTARNVAAATPVAATASGRIAQNALHAGLVNATLGAGGEAAFGDEHGQRNLGDIAVHGLEQGVIGAGLGAGMGALAEGAGALAKRSVSAVIPETPIVAPSSEPLPEPVADGVQYRHAGPGLDPVQAGRLRTGYRKALVTPYAAIEQSHPELTDALNTSGAAKAAALHLSTRGADWTLEGLTPEQEGKFGQQLVLDNMKAEAARKAESDPVAAQNFTQHATQLAERMGGDVSDQPWFQNALAKHNQYVAPTMDPAAIGAGVSAESFRQPSSAYVKLISEDRLTNKEIRRAMDANEVADPGDLKPRGPFLRSLIGERPGLTRLFPTGTESLREGPLDPNVPQTGTDTPRLRRGATVTGSAQGATGSAREYVTDYRRILAQDAMDKLPRAADNAVYAEVAKAGRMLEPGEEPALGKQAHQRLVNDENGVPTSQRFELDPKVADALRTYEARKAVTDQSGWRKFTSGAVRAQIAGMPVEATSHMNTLASIVASVPGEQDIAGKAMAAVPGVGGKLAAVREMAGMDFPDPETRTLETRLAQIGALRVDEQRGGLVNTSHNALFGPEGVDVRGRLVLARKYLDRKPDASDAELREFITSKLGNYNRANSGAAVNALQDAGISSFARFQAARVPSSIRSTFGASGLPATSKMQAARDVANTLYRGPIGYGIAGELANRAMTGHSMFDNEKGHQADVQLPGVYGPHERPLYVPLAFTNPAVATGLRATGLRNFVPQPGSPNFGGRVADAFRDMANTGLGVVSPAVRGLSVATSGRTPYMLSDGSMLRTTNATFDQGSNIKNRFVSALTAANPATSAFAEQGGDLGGHTLASALDEDGRFGGGPKAMAARVAEFLLPRVASVGVGGRDNEMSAASRDEREYNAAMQDYKAAIRRATGPQAQDTIIAAAVKDAETDGRFDPDKIQKELEKYADQNPDMRQAKSEKAVSRFQRTHER